MRRWLKKQGFGTGSAVKKRMDCTLTSTAVWTILPLQDILELRTAARMITPAPWALPTAPALSPTGTALAAICPVSWKSWTIWPPWGDGLYLKGVFAADSAHKYDTRDYGVDVFFQQLVLLFTLPGSLCVYYGTGIALPGHWAFGPAFSIPTA